MRHLTILALASLVAAGPALAAGDLLVAPTRVVLDRARGTEVILNNMGAETATYRVSLELKRMDADGRLVEVTPATATPREQETLGLISYAPRRVTLPPGQSQTIRVGARLSDALADGEYRAHLMFRAIPDATAAVTSTPREGVSIALTPIYGVTIPVIVRKGSLSAVSTISDVRVVRGASPTLGFKLTRAGTRSLYGRIRVTKPGSAKPVFEARGIAVYAEVDARQVTLPISPAVATALTGQVTVDYLEDDDTGATIATTRALLR